MLSDPGYRHRLWMEYLRKAGGARTSDIRHPPGGWDAKLAT